MIAFARRAIRCSSRPSRAISIRACRSAAERKPPRIMPLNRIQIGTAVKQFSAPHRVGEYQAKIFAAPEATVDTAVGSALRTMGHYLVGLVPQLWGGLWFCA